MKAIFFFLVGAVCGAVALHLYNEREPLPMTGTAASAADRTRSAGADLRDSINDKLADWHLTGPEIKDDLARTGEVVRSKAAVASEKISDARIVTVIKSKYVLDRDLSALDINVDCTNGDVTLHGTVSSPELVGRAMALALDTDGVRNVDGKLSVAVK